MFYENKVEESVLVIFNMGGERWLVTREVKTAPHARLHQTGYSHRRRAVLRPEYSVELESVVPETTAFYLHA